MAQHPRIRTPLGTHWRRIRFQLVPVAAFVAVIYLGAWLWGRQYSSPDTIGEVLADRRNVASLVDGKLIELPGREWLLSDSVQRGDVVARLDPRPFQLELQRLQSELDGLVAQLSATTAELRTEALEFRSDRLGESRQLAVDIESLKLQIIQHEAMLNADQVELALREQLLADIENALDNSPGAVTTRELYQARQEGKLVEEQIVGHKRFLAEAREQLQVKTGRFASYREQVDALYNDQIKDRLEPFKHSVEAKKVQIAEIEFQVESLEIRSAISGKIAAIYRYPGERVAAHEPILTIAADKSDRVISYVRQNQRITPVDNMQVLVRLRSNPNKTMEGRVVGVGAQVEPVPAHQLMDQTTPEWGLPIVIAIPEESKVHPGELVDVSLQHP